MRSKKLFLRVSSVRWDCFTQCQRAFYDIEWFCDLRQCMNYRNGLKSQLMSALSRLASKRCNTSPRPWHNRSEACFLYPCHVIRVIWSGNLFFSPLCALVLARTYTACTHLWWDRFCVLRPPWLSTMDEILFLPRTCNLLCALRDTTMCSQIGCEDATCNYIQV